MIRILLLVALCASALSAGPQGSQSRPARGQGTGQPRLDWRACDTDGDGAVSAEEWRAFLSAFPPSADGKLDPAEVVARLLLPALDQDRDRKVTAQDLEALLGAAGGAASRRAFPGLGVTLVRHFADADRDGTVSDAERAAFVRAQVGADGAMGVPALGALLARAKAEQGGEVGAMTPGVMVLTLESALDADHDGKVTKADLETLRKQLDADGDGTLSVAELTPPAAFPGGQGAGQRGGGRGGQRGAVTDEQRAKPPLMPWQRNLDDALELQRRTQKPLLIAVNADGEPASEQLAWGRYRDPEFCKLAAGFVCVLASPDEREPRGHDDRGARLPDKRFGRVIDREHIDIEPLVFARWFNNNRVAPRHIGVAPDGKVLFDLFLLQDLSQIDAALAKHTKSDAALVDPRTLDEKALLDSPDAACRDELEARFLAGDAALKVRLAAAACDAKRGTRHPEIVRMALADRDPAVRRAGAAQLARTGGVAELDLFRPAFHAATGDHALTRELIAALDRAARTTPESDLTRRAATWRALQTGLAAESKRIDRVAWREALAKAAAAPEPEELEAIERELDKLDEKRKVAKGTDLDAEAARLTLRFALATQAAGKSPSIALVDARAYADKAIASTKDPRAYAVAAHAAFLQGEGDAALDYATQALPGLAALAATRLAKDVLAVLATRTQAAVYAAINAGTVQPDAVADLRAACELLLEHPAAGEENAVAYLDFLDVAGGWGHEARAARAAVRRWPNSAKLHECWRGQLLRDVGAAGLEAAYAETAPQGALPASWSWFVGYAELVAAERFVQDRRPAEAIQAYEKSASTFARSIQQNPDLLDNSSHFEALARSGRGRVLADTGRWEDAAADAVAALERRPASADSKDGLGNTPRANATAVGDRAAKAGKTELAERVRAALGKLGQ